MAFEKVVAEMFPIEKLDADTTGKLRNVHFDNDKFLNIKRSMVTNGFFSHKPILARHQVDSEGNKMLDAPLIVGDGHHRVEAAKAAGITMVPVIIEDDLTPEQILMVQYQSNEHVQTTLKEKAQYFKVFCAAHPQYTQSEVAEIHSISQTELSKILRFDRLTDEAKQLIDDKKIKATAALTLVTVPPAFQNQYLKEAMEMPVGEFVEYIQDQRSAIRQAQREGRATAEKQISPKMISADEAKARLARETKIMEEMDEDHEDYRYQQGRYHMIQEILQVDAETLKRKAEMREATKQEKQVERARRRKEAAEQAYKEVMEKNQAQAEAEQAPVDALA